MPSEHGAQVSKIKLYVSGGQWRDANGPQEESRAIEELAHRIVSAHAYNTSMTFDEFKIATKNLIQEATVD